MKPPLGSPVPEFNPAPAAVSRPGRIRRARRFWLEITEALRIALDSIRANRLRAVLATLGIVVGIVTATLMGTAIEALGTALMQSISALGADVLHVSRTSWFNRSPAIWQREMNRPGITVAQARQLARELKLARNVAPWTQTRQTVRYRDGSASGVTIIGTTEQFLNTGALTLQTGRFITAAESDGGRPVCVIGADVAETLFPNQSPLGAWVRIGGHPFEVVGTLGRQGKFLGQFSLDNQLIVPVRQFIASFWSNPECSLQVKAIDLASLEECREELRGVMRRVRRLPPGTDDDFSINQQESFLRMFRELSLTITAVGGFITGLALFVGGIGVMNIMFVSVAERTREIGVRKALGAKRRAILIQFLAEASALCLAAGVIALLVAWPLTLVMGQFLPARLSVPVAVQALVLALSTGVAAGLLPAWRAARLNPVDALRQE